MKCSSSWVFVIFCFVLPIYAEDLPEVTIKQGRLQGLILHSRKGRTFFGFKGVPYAQPPLGDLRFKAPVPAKAWSGIKNATMDSSICIQRNVYLRSEAVVGKEDCLYLNVYSAKLSTESPHPVMVWMHGGGWVAGSGISRYYDPLFLLDKDIVLVTLNYRVGPIGFMSTGDSVSPGNYGFKDQVLALRWIQDNIVTFGGDKQRVTIFGESAGGASVHYHMLSPMSKGLFHRAISMSGTALVPWAIASNTTDQTSKLARLLACPEKPSEILIECMRKRPAEDIIATDRNFMEWDVDPMTPFRPAVESDIKNGEEAFIPRHPLEILQDPTTLFDIPWMVGITSGDGALKAAVMYNDSKLVQEFNEKFQEIAPINLLYRDTSPAADEVSRRIREFYFNNGPIDFTTVKNVVDLMTDVFFFWNTDEALRLHLKRTKAPVYYYLFDHRGSNSYNTIFGDKIRNYGVTHADDLLYLFPMSALFSSERTERDQKMIEVLTSLWTNFAALGNPTPILSDHIPIPWPAVSSEYAEYLIIGPELSTGRGLYRPRAEFGASLPLRRRSIIQLKDEL